MLQRIMMVEAVAITVIGLVLAAILFPVLAQNNSSPRGVVYGVGNTPLPHAVLRFHDPLQLSDIEITTNESGSFSRPGLDKVAYLSTNGYAVARFMGNSKGAGTYVFSPRGTQFFTFQDVSGHPLRNLSLLFSPDPRTYRTPRLTYFYRTTNEKGTVTLAQIPMVARYLIESNDKRWKVSTIAPAQGAPNGQYARVLVTLTPSE